jgi:hypothetical protein
MLRLLFVRIRAEWTFHRWKFAGDENFVSGETMVVGTSKTPYSSLYHINHSTKPVGEPRYVSEVARFAL